jgi:hypothetical protein
MTQTQHMHDVFTSPPITAGAEDNGELLRRFATRLLDCLFAVSPIGQVERQTDSLVCLGVNAIVLLAFTVLSRSYTCLVISGHYRAMLQPGEGRACNFSKTRAAFAATLEEKEEPPTQRGNWESQRRSDSLRIQGGPWLGLPRNRPIFHA